ncbi:hypothetical protein GCM10025776_18880 [Corallincola platygyrae]
MPLKTSAIGFPLTIRVFSQGEGVNLWFELTKLKNNQNLDYAFHQERGSEKCLLTKKVKQ